MGPLNNGTTIPLQTKYQIKFAFLPLHTLIALLYHIPNGKNKQLMEMQAFIRLYAYYYKKMQISVTAAHTCTCMKLTLHIAIAQLLTNIVHAIVAISALP